MGELPPLAIASFSHLIGEVVLNLERAEFAAAAVPEDDGANFEMVDLESSDRDSTCVPESDDDLDEIIQHVDSD